MLMLAFLISLPHFSLSLRMCEAKALGGPPSRTTFVLALDGEPVGWAQAHGRWVTWV